MSKETLLARSVVLDTETTHMIPEEAEIVEVAGASYADGHWKAAGFLLGARDGIPPEASAKNNISSRMIAGKPLFAESADRVKSLLRWDEGVFWVAHNATYDQTVLAKAWLEAGSERDAEMALDQTRWICTFRLAKHLLDFDFPNMQYNLSYLRYKLDLPVPDGMGVHRATDDTIVCASLYELLVDYALETGKVDPSKDMGRQLSEICWSPIAVKNWPFGKHKGVPLEKVPSDYYIWALNNLDSLKEGSTGFDADLAHSISQELARRVRS